MKTNRPEFSVYAFLPNGHHVPLERFVDVYGALRCAKRACLAPGPAERIIVTDGGDCIAFEWQRDLGVTFPTEDERSHA